MRLQHHPFGGSGENRNQERRAPPREQQSGSGSQRHQHDAFGQQLADQPAATRANREPHRHLVLPRGGAGEQQVGHIGAADEQYDADDRHHDHQRLRVGAAQLVRASGRGHERDAAEVAAPVARHPDFRQVGVPQRLEIRACRLDVRAGRETPDHAQPPALFRLQTLFDEHHGKRDVDRLADLEAEEPGRCHADDGDPLGADLDALPEHGGIPAKPARPEAVADHGHRAMWAAAPRLGIVRGRQHSSVDSREHRAGRSRSQRRTDRVPAPARRRSTP